MIGSKGGVKSVFHAKKTIEFCGLWEQLNNSNFKRVEFDSFKNEAGTNAFTLSYQTPKESSKKCLTSL